MIQIDREKCWQTEADTDRERQRERQRERDRQAETDLNIRVLESYLGSQQADY